MSKWFYDTSTGTAARAARYGSFVGEGLGIPDVSYRGTRWRWGFMWFGPLQRNTLRPRAILCCIIVGRLKASVVPLVALGSAFNWTFDNLSAPVVRPAFYSSMPGSCTVTQGSTCGPRVVGSLYSKALMARSSKWYLQQCGHAWSCCLPHCTQPAVWCRVVESLGTVVVPNEWSAVLALHCSRLPARLTGTVL
jgi:hypothetical protein